MLELKNTLNAMVDQLNAFAAEVTRVSREVGVEGRLGGQAEVLGRARHVEGAHRQRQPAWRRNLTNQVRDIALVTTAVAKGDLTRKITVDAKGEILELKNTVNIMVDQLSAVRRPGDPPGDRGRHRGQAGRPGRRARRVAAPGAT